VDEDVVVDGVPLSELMREFDEAEAELIARGAIKSREEWAREQKAQRHSEYLHLQNQAALRRLRERRQ
jgi:hypothetical protein